MFIWSVLLPYKKCILLDVGEKNSSSNLTLNFDVHTFLWFYVAAAMSYSVKYNVWRGLSLLWSFWVFLPSPP